MNYNFIVLRFFLFVLINFFFCFQFFFSLNLFFSGAIDEELIICIAIFFVFILFINQIISGLHEMLKARVDAYLNIFLLSFKLLRKGLKRFKKHIQKSAVIRSWSFAFLFQIFLKNLSSFFICQIFMNIYWLNFCLKNVGELILGDFLLKNTLKERFFFRSFVNELKYLHLVRLLSYI